MITVGSVFQALVAIGVLALVWILLKRTGLIPEWVKIVIQFLATIIVCGWLLRAFGLWNIGFHIR